MSQAWSKIGAVTSTESKDFLCITGDKGNKHSVILVFHCSTAGYLPSLRFWSVSAISNNPPGDVPCWWHHLTAWEFDGSLAVLVPMVLMKWWAGSWGAGGRTTAKNTRSALSTSERCTQGPHAAQTEIKSREDSGRGVYVCVCVFICVCLHYHQIYQVISLHHHLL